MGNCLVFSSYSLPLIHSVKILSLVFKIARNSFSSLLQLVQIDAMELLGYLLERVNPGHLSIELLSCIFGFSSYLMAAPNGSELLCHVIEHLLFNPGLWIKAHKNVISECDSVLCAVQSQRVA